ncbi:AraC family transcriptional regulator [Longispora fulva]|uniref:AraC-like DNA-binding protein n=1 Tax=Longispora fulva TaxID=619741 RepID=A0A8J7KV90_9ACTN|nr:AraC family transcriptional regulator [Longispora fulva]MBG6135002.1 AraC-like DNA-binding protein [Longispora fulva]GIG56766.1 AraC family transcriptional regulator [Longispora fulva]
MENATERAVERVVTTMRDKLGEELTIDDMARVAMFSKFHFSRIFQRITGVSPGRFLSALRLQEAKQLLTSTSFNVTEVSLRVGYSSVGTFSSRFTRSVGLSPTTYRRAGGFTPQLVVDNTADTAGPAYGTVRGTAWADSGEHKLGLVFVGLFPGRIPEGRPVSCAVLDGPGEFVLDKVPAGQWFLLSHSVADDPDERLVLHPSAEDHQTVYVGSRGPLVVEHDGDLADIDLKLRLARSFDPPVLLDIRTSALTRLAHQAAA